MGEPRHAIFFAASHHHAAPITMPINDIDDLSEGVLFEVDGRSFLSCGRTRARELTVIRLSVRSNGRDYLDVPSLETEIDEGNVHRLDTYKPDEETVVPTDDLVTVMARTVGINTPDYDVFVESARSIENRLPDSAYDFKYR